MKQIPLHLIIRLKPIHKCNIIIFKKENAINPNLYLLYAGLIFLYHQGMVIDMYFQSCNKLVT